MGSLIRNGDSENAPPRPSPIFPFIRSNFMLADTKSRLEIQNLFHNLPVEIVTVPPNLLQYTNGHPIREVGAKALALYLSQGSPCPETPTEIRSTRIMFICPAGLRAKHDRNMNIVKRVETKTCHYDLIIENPSVCAIPALRPPLPEAPTVIRENNELLSRSDY